MSKPAAVQNKMPVKESDTWLVFEYIMQTYGGLALLVIVVLGMAGLFSDGIFSTTRLHDATQTLRIDYEKIGRIDSDMNIKIETAEHSKNITLTLGGDWMEANEITSLYPVATRMTSRNGALILEYDTGGQAGPFAVWLGVTPRKAGHHTYRLRTGDAVLTFSQFVLP